VWCAVIFVPLFSLPVLLTLGWGLWVRLLALAAGIAYFFPERGRAAIGSDRVIGHVIKHRLLDACFWTYALGCNEMDA